jgi:hypothetical protein
LAQAADAVLAALPSVPPSSSQPYARGEETGSIRASLQRALDHWTPGQVTLSAPAAANLDRSDTRSFGETHAAELQQIQTDEHHLGGAGDSSPVSNRSPAGASVPLPIPVPIQKIGSGTSPTSSPQTHRASLSSPLAEGLTPGINPGSLNNEPAPIAAMPDAVGVTLPGTDTEAKVPSVTPTVAETGIPVSGGTDGPGPSSGSLLDIRSSKSSLSRTPIRKEGDPILHGDAPSTGTSAHTYESAGDEKKRLEREERERSHHDETQGDDGGETPPPYEEM